MKRIAALACAVLAACAQTSPQGDDPSEPPAYPAATGLVEFLVSRDFRFFVDGETLSVSRDGVIRYVVVARSSAGAENVSYEALRCASSEYRAYAVGLPGRKWGGRPSEWRSILAPPVQRWRSALYREYFCPQKEPIRDAAEGLRALRDGGHPFYKAFDR